MPALVVLDAGTGGAKCSVFDATGRLLASATESWTYAVRTHPAMPLLKEYGFDPAAFWSTLARCTRTALASAAVEPADIVGVATTSQREGCVFLDADGCEVYAGPNLDSRGFLEGLEILGDLGLEPLYALTGHSAPFIFPLARLLWYRKHRQPPVARLLMINDWMAWRLSGALSSEPTNACESMLFDVRRRTWSAEILDHFAIAPEILPPLVEPGARIGTVHARAAAETGLPAGTAVFAGGADTQCALLGAGALEPGTMAAICGTTTPVQMVVDQPLLDPACNLWAGCHVVPDRWVLESNVGSTGDALLWLVDLLVPEGPDRFARAEALAAAGAEGGTYAFLGPRIFDLTKIRPDLPGGVFFRFPALQLRPTAGDLLRALLESIAFAVRANLEQLAAVSGNSTGELRIGGGISRLGLFVQLVADALDRPVRRAVEPQSTGLGCATLIAVGAGVYPDLATAIEAMCRHERIEPNARGRDAMATGYARWRELYDALDTISV